MGYNEFMEGQRTETELRMLCSKVDNEIKLETDRLKKVRLLDETGNDLYGIDLNSYDIVPSTEYDVSLLEAIAGNCSGFAAIAERDVQKNGLKKADGKWNNYVVALREMGYPCMNSFLYLQYIKANQQSEAKEYLNKALEQKEEIADFCYAYDILRKGKKRKGRSLLKKIAENKSHPMKQQASLLQYVPEDDEWKTAWGIVLGLCIVGVLIAPWFGSFSGFVRMVSLLGVAVMGGVVPWIVRKYKNARQIKFANFNGAIMEHKDKAFGATLICPEYPTSELSNSESIAFFADEVYKRCHTQVNVRDLSEINDVKVLNIQMLALQLHSERERRKQYFMDKCKAGDASARVALLVFFDTEYRNGEFVVNKNANPCRFIPDTIGKIID